jgi:hypothetical protein
LAANLAASMAETGKRTILINTDFRRPRLASVLGPAATVPLPFTLEDLDRLDARSLLNKTDRDNLLLFDLSTIEGSPGELLRATIDKLPELKHRRRHRDRHLPGGRHRRGPRPGAPSPT